jgi:hypothetical protein
MNGIPMPIYPFMRPHYHSLSSIWKLLLVWLHPGEDFTARPANPTLAGWFIWADKSLAAFAARSSGRFIPAALQSQPQITAAQGSRKRFFWGRCFHRRLHHPSSPATANLMTSAFVVALTEPS